MRSKFDDLNKRDLQAFIDRWAEDATFIFRSYISAGGEIKGKKVIEEWFHEWMKQFPKFFLIFIKRQFYYAYKI